MPRRHEYVHDAIVCPYCDHSHTFEDLEGVFDHFSDDVEEMECHGCSEEFHYTVSTSTYVTSKPREVDPSTDFPWESAPFDATNPDKEIP